MMINYSALLGYYKKFTVNSTGAILLMKEITKYQDLFASFSTPEITVKYESLRGIGNLFISKIEGVKAVVGEGWEDDVSGAIEYLRCRDDWVGMAGMERDMVETGSIGALNSVKAGGDMFKGFKM
jgi:hypothetical protein